MEIMLQIQTNLPIVLVIAWDNRSSSWSHPSTRRCSSSSSWGRCRGCSSICAGKESRASDLLLGSHIDAVKMSRNPIRMEKEYSVPKTVAKGKGCVCAVCISQCVCVLWLGECVCANAKFVKNYRVALALSLFEFSKPNCYVVWGFFFGIRMQSGGFNYDR